MVNNNINKTEEKALTLYAKVFGVPKRFEKASFDNYEVTADNKRMFDSCINYKGVGSMILTGKAGTGKTHLAISMLKRFPMQPLTEQEAESERRKMEAEIKYNENELVKKMYEAELYKYRSAKCKFVSIIDVFLDLNAEEDKRKAFNQYISSAAYDCICFDDLGAERLTEASRANFYHILDSRYGEMLPTIITSNLTIEEIDRDEPRIASRLSEMGNVLYFGGQDYRLNKIKDCA
jgi:DNA replication protein DnaC